MLAALVLLVTAAGPAHHPPYFVQRGGEAPLAFWYATRTPSPEAPDWPGRFTTKQLLIGFIGHPFDCTTARAIIEDRTTRVLDGVTREPVTSGQLIVDAPALSAVELLAPLVFVGDVDLLVGTAPMLVDDDRISIHDWMIGGRDTFAAPRLTVIGQFKNHAWSGQNWTRVFPGHFRDPESNQGKFIFYDEAPVRLSMPSPVYPERAARNGIEGEVGIDAFIDEHGKVTWTKITRSAPFFDESATRAVRSSRWKPAMCDGEPIGVWVRFPVKFMRD